MTSCTTTEDKLHVAIIIDITGSMSGEIEVVKMMVREYVKLYGTDPNLQLHVLTYTESYKKTYVSYKTINQNVESHIEAANELKNWVENIELSIDPTDPKIYFWQKKTSVVWSL